MVFTIFWIFYVNAVFFQKIIHCVHITDLHVPRGASHEAPLDCRYDLEGGKLYDVKWYKDGEQFYRCAENGTVQAFIVEGVKIYHSNFTRTGSCPLKLTSLTSKSAGDYTCEVSLDGPSFATVSRTSSLRFIETLRRTQNDTKNRTEDVRNSENDILFKSGSSSSTTLTNLLFILSCIILNKI